jgi:ribonuclease J
MSKIASDMQKEKSLRKAQFVYSLWSGYLARDPKFTTFCKTYRIPLKQVHSSGHAFFDDLKRLTRAIHPKALVPIHTVSGDDYKSYFPNVVRLDDGDEYTL